MKPRGDNDEIMLKQEKQGFQVFYLFQDCGSSKFVALQESVPQNVRWLLCDSIVIKAQHSLEAG